ncbi:MAG: prepilin-type N-terminal cleavage/methylation domain-containing protein [bacterium]|nr:prepilin-type N-terminal cleavage/methylation domain-containing protein [bacterium]
MNDILPPPSSYSRSGNRESGFTLIEVAIAVAILGIGLTTLITVQTRNVDRYLAENMNFSASLYARYIMTAIETSRETPETGSEDGKLEEKLDELGYFSGELEASEALKEEIRGWRYNQEVSSVGISPLEDVLRRIDLKVIWGESESEGAHLIYFAYVRKKNMLGGR